jgi:hypothetical protein
MAPLLLLLQQLQFRGPQGGSTAAVRGQCSRRLPPAATALPELPNLLACKHNTAPQHMVASLHLVLGKNCTFRGYLDAEAARSNTTIGATITIPM